MATHPDVVAEIGAAIGEDMRVVDSASDEVQRTRGRCRTLEGRLRALLKPLPGEVSEQVRLRFLTRHETWKHVPGAGAGSLYYIKVEGRQRALLKPLPGEVSEQV